jgi:hypothetical protein
VTADATVQAVTSYLGGDDWARVSFLENGFRGRFEDACVERYSTIRLGSKNTRGGGVEVEVTASESEDGHWSDVRSDSIVEALLRRGDTELEAATGLISVPTDVRTVANNEPFYPRVTIGFPAGRVTFEEFAPEQILLAVDDIVQGCR